MSKLKDIREQQNLTQEELSERSGLSVRTIQRIEAGKDPKGYTLRILSAKLGVPEISLLNKQPGIDNKEAPSPTTQHENPVLFNYALIRLINLSSIPFVILPPLNILLPLILMYTTKQKNPITRQIVSVQIMWTIVAPLLFLLGVFMKLGSGFTPVLMLLLAASNVYIVLRNAVEIDKKNKLYYKLDFNMI
ncbi:MAG: helix-turn-helix transcriptional regulator [Bacteroidetes bacterium]|nr:helix-turn-helix transcriptional regulator [Bacteroidota bacterium]